MILNFPKDEVLALVQDLSPKDSITLVNEVGSYLVAVRHEEPRPQVFALGCNPNVDRDYYRISRDRAVVLGTVADIQRVASACQKNLRVALPSRTLILD